MGDSVAGRSAELHPAVGRRGAGVGHRRRADARMERLGTEGAAVQLGADGVVRRDPHPQSGRALSVQRGSAGSVPRPPGGQALSGVRPDQRAPESRAIVVRRPAGQVGAAVLGRALVCGVVLVCEGHGRADAGR